MDKNAPKIAAIDVGTNSFHLIITSMDHRGMLKVHHKEKEMVRLGSSGKDMKYIQADAIDRGVAALKKFADIAKSEKAEIYAIATSAVREAANKEEFLERAKKESGVEIQAVSGAEEGRLIYLGVTKALPVENQRTLVIDIGGGSTETVIGNKGEVKFVHSEKIGAIRLTRKFFPDGVSTPDRVEKCREFINGAWGPVFKRLIETGFETTVGSSGTITNIVAMAITARNDILPEDMNGSTVERKEILRIIEKIVSKETPEERKEIPSLDPRRADIIVAGALILERAVKNLNIQHLVVSSYALREGIVYYTIQKNEARVERKQLSHLRYQTIRNICDRYNVMLEHSERVKKYALKIYDELQLAHGLNFIEREWLEAAALLHDVGYYISRDKHHKHSYYLISNCDMPGFTEDEAEVIANISRYHRKSHPKPKHSNYMKLTEDKRRVVRILGGILRIAEGIDRRQLGIVGDLEFKQNGGDFKIILVPNSSDVKPDIELWGGERRKNLLEDTLDLEISFEIKHEEIFSLENNSVEKNE